MYPTNIQPIDAYRQSRPVDFNCILQTQAAQLPAKDDRVTAMPKQRIGDYLFAKDNSVDAGADLTRRGQQSGRGRIRYGSNPYLWPPYRSIP